MGRAALPTLTFGALAATIAGDRPTPIGYATTARWSDGRIVIAHHGSDIATLERHTIRLDSHGYDSVTTAHRLDAVLADNRTGYRAAIRGGMLCALSDDDLRPVGTFRTLTLRRAVSGRPWALDALEPCAAEVGAILDGIRASIAAESVSYSELADLQGLAHRIPAGDTVLLEWAGIAEVTA